MLVSHGLNQAKEPDSNWGRLFASDVVSATIQTEEHRGYTVVSRGEFVTNRPKSGEEAITIRHFKLTKNEDKMWRLHLPAWLISKRGGNDIITFKSDADLAAMFPMALFEKTKSSKFKNPAGLGSAYIRDMSSPFFAKLIPYISAEDKTSAEKALNSYSLEWRLARRTQIIRLLIDTFESGDKACALYYELDPYNPELHPSLIRQLYMVRRDSGWLLHPDASQDPEEFSEEIDKWISKNRERNNDELLPMLGLKDQIGGLAADSAPKEEEARKFAAEWMKALESRDVLNIFAQSTIFNEEDSTERLLKSIGEELRDEPKLELLGMHQNGRWAAASIRHNYAAEGIEPSCKLHIFVTANSEIKALPEATLLPSNDRLHDLRNRSTYLRLGKKLPDAAINELKKIQEEHTRLCEAKEASE